MKVVLVNHSDTLGGASVVSVRLLDALQDLGVDARMLVVHKALTVDEALTGREGRPRPGYPDGRDDIALIGNPLTRKLTFLAEHADIYLHNGLSRKDLFKVSTGRFGLSIHDHPWVREADVVVLNWVNQGMVSLREIARIKAPVVWTMHDMWCMTGVCHHSVECIAYTQRCGNCRLLHGGTAENDLSRRTWLAKQSLYTRKPIHFVAVSNWLARKCRESGLLGELGRTHQEGRTHHGASLQVIPNAFPVEQFSLTPSRSREACGLPSKGKLIVMGAARLDDPIKGLDIAIEALNKLRDTGATAVFFGSLRDRHAFDGLRIPYVWMGRIDEPLLLRDIYAHADVVLSSSHYETLPGTLVEGMAAGCVPVTFGRGGQADIVDHLRTGYIASYPSADNLSEGIRYALADHFDPAAIRASVAARFSAEAVARQYLALFNSIINKPDDVLRTHHGASLQL